MVTPPSAEAGWEPAPGPGSGSGPGSSPARHADGPPPPRTPACHVAQAWAAVAQGWETLSHAEAARSVAAAAFTVDQTAFASTPRSRSATAAHGRTRRCGRPLRTYPRQTGDGPGGVRSRREGEQYDHLASHMLSGNRGRP